MVGWRRSVVCLALLVACAPPREVHGRPAFDEWVAANTYTLVGPITATRPDGSTLAGYYAPWLRLIGYDPVQLAAYGDREEWARVHEQGHAASYALGLNDDMPALRPEERAEQAAQCVTEVVLGYDAPWTVPGGYWDCPADYVALTRGLMIAAGMF